jgi:hypothetical protein
MTSHAPSHSDQMPAHYVGRVWENFVLPVSGSARSLMLTKICFEEECVYISGTHAADAQKCRVMKGCIYPITFVRQLYSTATTFTV